MPTKQDRFNALCPGGVPRWWRFYDNEGASGDRYTIIQTGKNADFYRGCSRDPFHPQGIGVSGSRGPSDPSGPLDTWDRRVRGLFVPCKVGKWHPNRNLGKRVRYEDLPPKVQECVCQDEAHRRGWSGKKFGAPYAQWDVRIETTDTSAKLVWKETPPK